MTDLHCHILPGLDDGAKDLDVSGELLRRQCAAGVQRVAFTPHFHFERQDVDQFCRRRDAAAAELVQCYPELASQLELKKGAEVFFSPTLLESDPRPLCLEGTGLMLVELPVTYRPQWTVEVLYQLGTLGITPLIAHVERYPYVMEDPNLLIDWIEAGAYTHVNASSLVLHKRRRAQILKMIRHGLVHLVCTDAHSPDKRPPLLGQAMELVRRRCGGQKAQEMEALSLGLWRGEQPEPPAAAPMRRLLGRLV